MSFEIEDGKEVLGRREDYGVDWVRNGEVENGRRVGIQFLTVRVTRLHLLLIRAAPPALTQLRTSSEQFLVS